MWRMRGRLTTHVNQTPTRGVASFIGDPVMAIHTVSRNSIDGVAVMSDERFFPRPVDRFPPASFAARKAGLAGSL
jgi:hypothetical protein